MSDHPAEQPTASDRVVTWIRRLRVPIVLFWMFLAAATNVFVPQLEKVGEEHNVALSAPSAPSMKAFKRIGAAFHEFEALGTPRDYEAALAVLGGRIAEGVGRLEDARRSYHDAAESDDRPAAAESTAS